MGLKERYLNGYRLDLSDLDQDKLRAVVKSVMKFRVEESVVMVYGPALIGNWVTEILSNVL
jgi:hypothetical protein